MTVSDKAILAKLYSGAPAKDLTEIPKKDALLTGIKKIDERFGFPTGYYIILGAPGSGKSWLSLWLSRVFYRLNGVQSVYFSLEMPETMVRKRILQQWSDIPYDVFESGQANTSKAVELMQKDVLIVDEFYPEDTKQRTPENFVAWIDEYYKLGYRVFHFDHFHELDGAATNDMNQMAVEKWGLTFQKLCKKYEDIWLIIYAQPNASSSSKSILRRTDLMGSKALAYKCDYFLSINRLIDPDDLEKTLSDDTQREVIFYLDKTRYTNEPHVGFKLHFSETGNFFSIEEGYAEQ